MQIKEISATKLPDIGIKRVAAYARVSSDKEAAIHSLSSQISYYNEYISNHVGWEFAGVYADEIHNQVCDLKYHIIPKKGDYVLLDKNMGTYVNMTLFTLPTEKGKGVLVTPTVHGNLLAGPTSTVIDDKEGNNTTSEELKYVMDTALIKVAGTAVIQ